MTIHRGVSRSIVLALVVACSSSCRCTSRLGGRIAGFERPRHVVLIVVDTLRADEVPFLAGARSTPAMARLADDGIVFAHAASAAPWTLPSVASIMTGVDPLVHGCVETESVLPPGIPTLAEHMHAAGYRTAAAGANPSLKARTGLARGFDEYHINVQDWFEEKRIEPPPVEWLEEERRGMFFYTSTPYIERFALDWIERNEESDFFLWLHFLDPHGPYYPPPGYRPAGPVSGTALEAIHTRGAARSLGSEADRRIMREFYRGEVRWVDDAIGRILDELDALDLYDGALIVLVSDHGEEFWDHGGADHGHTLYEELLHVPLVVKLPGRSGRFTHAVLFERVSILGLAPMVLDACRIEAGVPGGYSLSSLVGLGAAAYAGPPLFAGAVKFGGRRDSVAFGSMKYIRSAGLGEEIYDLGADPGEESPLAGPSAFLEAGRHLLDLHIEAAGKLAGDHGAGKQKLRIDEKTREELEALGYSVDGD